jgi:hypothetical protein
LSGAELVRLERAALDRGLAWFRGELAALGVTVEGGSALRALRSPRDI